MPIKYGLLCILTIIINAHSAQAEIPVVGGEGDSGNWSPEFTFVRTVTVDELTKVISEEAPAFLGDVEKSYVYPDFKKPTNDVDIYRVIYSSVIPNLGNKPTMASGLIAVPRVPKKSLSVVSYQHGTVWGKLEVPSHSFYPSGSQPPKEYSLAFESRLAVSQFAGNGYIVIASDYFGLGDASKNPEGYGVKESHQQATLDMYRALRVFMSQKGLQEKNLFLAGWSQGGLVTMQFLEKLEREGIFVKAASTAAGPTDIRALMEQFLYGKRRLVAPWVNTVAGLAAFSHENYYGVSELARSFISPKYYDLLSDFYARKVDGVENPDTNDLYALFLKLPSNSNIKEMLLPEYSSRAYFRKSKIAKLVDRDQAYQWRYNTPVTMFYGDYDEVVSPKVAIQARNYQENHYHSKKINTSLVVGASHRGTFFSATAKQRDLFESLDQ